MDEQRIVELESRITYQEDYIRSLSQTVVTLQQQVDDLKRICELFGDKLRFLETEDSGETDGFQRPPHY